MKEPVKPRPYNASRRRKAAEQTRQSILNTASRLFKERGYTATTMAEIAEEAGVALDTIYASIGPKPLLFRMLVESAISGVNEPVPALQRDYVRAMQAEPDPARKLELYARAVRQIQERLAPLFHVLQQAAATDGDLAALWREIGERRSRNMRLLVADLAKTGALREGISIDEAADVIWSMNASEFYVLLVWERGWEPDQFERWLASAWKRLLLRDE